MKIIAFAGAAAIIALAACAKAPTSGAVAAAGGGSPAVGAPAVGAAPTAQTVAFTDPSENAYTISVPAGWAVKGGVQRTAAWSATPWTSATSPDGTSFIAVGDPSIPSFTLPNQYNAVGGTAQGANGPSPVEPYETGAQYAADYAQRAFGASCGPLQASGAGSEPGLAQAAQSQAASVAAQVGVQPAPITYDGGSAHFTATCGSAAFAIGVLAVTGLDQTQVGGFWIVPTLVAYRTPLALQAQTEAQARAMRDSYQVNAQWQAQMINATRQQLAVVSQQGAQGVAAMNQLQSQQFAAEDAQMQGAQAARNRQQAAFMNRFNAQGAAFQAGQAAQQYNQETQAQALTRMAGDQVCIAWYDAAHTRCRVTAHN